MQRVRIKICGITRPEDGLRAAMLGADAIGLVFYKASPRFVDVTTAGDILSSLPPFVTRVGLFVDEDEKHIRSVLDDLQLDLLQFHGEESSDACRHYGKPYIKAIRMQDGVDLYDCITTYHDAAGLLLDTHVEGMVGGTGTKFDWGQIPKDLDKPIILAGGLTTGNVLQAIEQVKPFAVDVSGGVEAEKGIKDHAKLAAFIQAVNKEF